MRAFPSYVFKLIFADLFGAPNRFFNIKIHEKDVYCTFCKGCVGNQHKFDDDLIIRNFRLIRIDPQYLISICIGATLDRNGNVLYHQHMSQVATVERDPDTPVEPIQLRSLRGGLLLTEPCIFASELMHIPPLTLIDQQRLSINLPQCVEKVGEIARGIKVPVTNKRKLKTYGTALKAQNNTVEPPAKFVREENRWSENTPSDDSFAEYLLDQPSTSTNKYNDSVEKEIATRKRLKSNNGTDLVSEHNYSQIVCFKSFWF